MNIFSTIIHFFYDFITFKYRGFIARRAAFMPSCLKQQQADRSSLRKNTAEEDASGGNLRMRAWTWRVLTIGQRPASWLPG